MALSTRQKQDIKRRQVQMGVKPKNRKPEKWLFPKSAERDYLKVLKVYVDTYRDLINQILIPQLDDISEEAKGYRPDGVRSDDWSDRISSLIQSVVLSFEDKAPKPDNFVPIVGLDVSEYNKEQFNKVFKSVMAVDIFIAEPWLKPQLNSFTKENVMLIKSIPSQSLTKIEGIVQRGVASGRLTRDIEKDIIKEYGIVERRAELIARDQVSKLNGQLTQYRQQEAGITSYVWRASLDERTRPEHEALDGEIFSWDEPSSEGHPGEAINCFPGSTKIHSFNGVNKLFRHFYTGHLTKIVTENGVLLEATPNHPVLTNRGWIPLKDVNLGDYIVSALDQRFNASGVQLQQSFPSFEDCFKAMNILFGCIVSASRKSDFHGDMTAQEVDIINIDCRLSDAVNTSIIEFFKKLIFSWSNMNSGETFLSFQSSVYSVFPGMGHATTGIVGFFSEFFNLLISGKLHPIIHSITSIPGGDVILDKPFVYNSSGNLVSLSQLFNAESISIEDKHLINRQLFKVMRLAISCSGVDCLNTLPGSQMLGEGVRMDVKDLSNFKQSKPLLIKFHRVVEKSVRIFSEHVYNLETDIGYYSVHNDQSNLNLIVHNCRCYAEANFSQLLDL